MKKEDAIKKLLLRSDGIEAIKTKYIKENIKMGIIEVKGFET